MDIFASDDQKLLQEMTRRFLEERSPVGALRKAVETGGAMDRVLWRDGAELGWTAIFASEAFGGIAEHGNGVIDASIIAEEMGRVVFAGTLIPVSVASWIINRDGTSAQKETIIPRLLSGEALIAWCFAGTGQLGGLEATGITAAFDGIEWSLDGEAVYVEDAEIADYLLVTAKDGTGLSQFLIPAATAGITVEALECLDLGRRLANVQMSGVKVANDTLLGEHSLAAPAFEKQLQIALVLQCSETIGVATRALEFTLEWVQQRIAFGRPIGSFQALKHRLADHATQLEGAKAITAHATRSVHEDAADAAAATSVAQSQCGRYAVQLIRDCLQMHGGIGMTWEHDIHLYLRRVVSNEALWGTPAAHHERLCRLAGL